MNTLHADIKTLVAESRLGDALIRLRDLSQGNKQIHDSIVIVLAEFNDLKSRQLSGTISPEEATLRQNKISEKVLIALELFDGEGSVVPGSVVGKKTSATGILGRITLYLWGGTALICLLAAVVLYILFGSAGIGENTFSIAIIPVLLGLVTFVGYVLAMVVSASKK